MKSAFNKNGIAVIVLHEIYGINPFIESVCADYRAQGFTVFCPDMLRRKHFMYSEVSDAYRYFMGEVGLEPYKNIEQLIGKLKLRYDKVFLVGFSVGAAIAWRCSENADCDGIVCCYGSRIRDYVQLEPCCPVLLLFAARDSFDVDGVIERLEGKPNVEIRKFEASHGFMDSFSGNYDRDCARQSKEYIHEFLKRYGESI